MKKVIGGILVLALLLAVACKKEETKNNYYRTGQRVAKEKIEAYAATWTPSALTDKTTTMTYTTAAGYLSWSTTTLYSDDLSEYIDGRGAVTTAYVYYYAGGTTLDYTYAEYAYSTFGVLHIEEGTKGYPYMGIGTAGFEEANRELVLPTDSLGGLDVSRKIMANPTGNNMINTDYTRWLEILTNNTGAPITVNVLIGGQVYDEPQAVLSSTDGDNFATPPDDNWFITRPYTETALDTSSYLYVGHLVDGSMGYSAYDSVLAVNTTGAAIPSMDYTYLYTSYLGTAGSYDISTWTTTAVTYDLQWQWNDVTVNPGETKILMHLELLQLPWAVNGDSGSRGLQDAIKTAKMDSSAPAEIVKGMSAEEINQVTNFPAAANNCNVSGPAKSVKPGVVVEVDNVTAGTSAQSYSLPDGSFGVCIDAAEKDVIKIFADGKLKRTMKAKAADED